MALHRVVARHTACRNGKLHCAKECKVILHEGMRSHIAERNGKPYCARECQVELRAGCIGTFGDRLYEVGDGGG